MRADLICPVCGTSVFGPLGETYCRNRHEQTLMREARDVIASVQAAVGPERPDLDTLAERVAAIRSDRGRLKPLAATVRGILVDLDAGTATAAQARQRLRQALQTAGEETGP